MLTILIAMIIFAICTNFEPYVVHLKQINVLGQFKKKNKTPTILLKWKIPGDTLAV